MAVDQKRYPANWKAISRRIRFERAEGRCECRGQCGRDHVDTFGRCAAIHGQAHPESEHTTRLACAHLDHTPENSDDDSNLCAMCEPCHLRHDRQHHARERYKTRMAGKVHRDLFDDDGP